MISSQFQHMVYTLISSFLRHFFFRLVSIHTNISPTERVFILFLAMTITYVYILDQINSVILNSTLFSKAFAISLERADQWSSTASGVTQTLLFSVSPTIFKVLANIEGSATSEGKSEQKAMVYFWYFFIVARFMGNIVWNAWLDFWQGSKYAKSWQSFCSDSFVATPPS